MRSVRALAIYLSLAVFLFVDTWADPLGRWVGRAGDPEQLQWFLSWWPFAVQHRLNPFFTDYLNFPSGVNLMWNTAIPAPAILISPVTILVGPVVAYNALMTLAPALSAWCALLAFRRYLANELAAGGAALVFGFSPYVVAQASGHLNLAFVFFPPLALLALDEILVRQRVRAARVGVLFGLLVTIQLLTSEEIVASTALVAAIAVVALALLHRRSVAARLRHAALALSVTTLTAGALCAYPLWVQFLGPQRLVGAIQSGGAFSTDLANFVVPGIYQAISTDWTRAITMRFTGVNTEWNGYLGLPLVAVIIGTCWRLRRDPVVRFAGIMALVCAVLSMGPHVHLVGHETRIPLPFRLVQAVPLLGNLLPSRLSLFTDLFVAVVFGIFLDHVVRTPARRLAGSVLAACCFATLLPSWPFPTTLHRAPAFFSDGIGKYAHGGDVVLVAPLPRSPYTMTSMLWQATSQMHFRSPDGYFIGPSDSGPRYGPPPSAVSRALEQIQAGSPPPELNREERARIASSMRQLQVRAVVVGPMVCCQRTALDYFTELFRRPPERDGEVYFWASGTVPP